MAESYKITDKTKGTVHKVDLKGQPDLKGLEFRIVDELEDGYIVYTIPQDPTQPNPNYFIHKDYFIKEK